MSDVISVKQQFIQQKCHDQSVWQMDVAAHFHSDLPLHFSLEQTPAWLSINEQGLLSGMVPAVRHDAQFVVTVVASTATSCAKLYILLDVYLSNFFDGMHEPMLNLMRANVKPRKHESETLQIMTYIFGYYHSHAHGEQFITKMREQLNEKGHHLPPQPSLHVLHETLQKEPEEVQYELLEAAAATEVFAEAQAHVDLELSSEPFAEFKEGRQHEVLEYIYAFLHAHHAQALHDFLHKHSHDEHAHLHMHAHPHATHHDYEHFKALLEEANPDLEKKLEDMPQGMLLTKVKLTDRQVQELEEEIEYERIFHMASDVLLELQHDLSLGKVKILLGHATQALIKMLQSNQLDPFYIVYLYHHSQP